MSVLTAPRSRPARSPTCTRSPPSSASTASAACARPTSSTASSRDQGGDGRRRPTTTRGRPTAHARRGAEAAPRPTSADDERRRRRGGRRAPSTADAAGAARAAAAAASRPRRRRARRRATPRRPTTAAERRDETHVEGVVELLANGSGFLRVTPPEPSDDDVYISAAQVRRCELVSGDRVAGPGAPAAPLGALPVARPRRHHQRPPADEVAEGTHFDDLPVRLPVRAPRARLRGPDAEGDRVADAVRPRLARDDHRRARARARPRRCARLAAALAGQEGLELSVVLAGVRPEEAAEWQAGPVEPAAALTLRRRRRRAGPGGRARDRDRQAHRRARRRRGRAHRHPRRPRPRRRPPRAGRGAQHRRRRLADGRSPPPPSRSAARRRSSRSTPRYRAGRFPALDLVASGTLRPELLVGDAGADAIAAGARRGAERPSAQRGT